MLMSVVRGLSLAYMPTTSVRECPEQWWDEVLGVAILGDGEAGFVPSGVPLARVATPVLAGPQSMCEVWRAGRPVRAGAHGRVRYRCTESMLFGAIELDERATPAGTDGVSALQRATGAAYREVFALLDEAGYPALFRAWNYFPAINAVADGSERYWQFNAGRQEAFGAGGRSTSGRVPAACALGSAHGPFTLYFIALREAPLAIENPRQVCAYHYPEQYGPRSPTFARASLALSLTPPVLFVSGTASIVGHETLHPGDVVAQTAESFRNIAAVLAEARRADPAGNGLAFGDLAYKVYVRNPGDLDAVRACFRAHVGDAVPVVYVQADVCRDDLLVEIEASGGHAMEDGR
ncbi:Enamine deaminase RidA, house cleaning of reactive enamine intermediates, YjgF/YER057c/UK114 family [Aromatoleum tolulyticum]|uniref:Enamine deaminase RidA, house cleaning of reactive enamine intermediates, YjgF/YER057c/UK114 family n=2 Tax=Aromatoleum tolulyticum TaxID=34027 RepID=A0A1N6U6P0_9RHOO|nr:Enamine deaminase RidA, house cleaning of reactive enamine intermediates, YjgF/YER057c/UK114 family [Aromatoleum tolulyticum]